MKGFRLLIFGAALFAAGLLVGMRVFAWHPYYPSYQACVVDNMQHMQSDGAARIIISACRKYS